MAFGDGLPFGESFGVFIGVAGFDWLADGYAEPMKAAGFALLAGSLLYLARALSRRRKG